MANLPSSAGAHFRSRPVLSIALVLAAVGAAPYVRAALAPLPGRAFTGYFWFTDDAYNYLSFVQQAEDGALAFRNKLVLEPHEPALVNPEWWAVGVLSRSMGRRPIAAYRVFAVAAILGLVAGIHAWLRDAGLPARHAAAALLLVCLGGGMGATCVLLGSPLGPCVDVASGLYPFMEILANPHFATGTALLLWSLRAFRMAHDGGGARAALAAAGLGSVLAVTRPYDAVLLVAIRTAVVLATDPPARWARHAGAMALLAPAVAYDAWVFLRVPAFASYTAIEYVFPPPSAFAWALAPPALVGLSAWAAGRARGVAVGAVAGRPERVTALHYAVWLGLGVLVIGLDPVNFSFQFLVGLGVPLLSLAALALSAFPPRATLAAAALLSTAAAAALRVTLLDSPAWNVSEERMAVARALRGHCRPGEILLAPPDIGLYAGGFSACTPYVSHAAAAGHAERAEAVRAFYQGRDPAAGAALLERACAAHLVLPASAALADHAGGAPFRPVQAVGMPPRAIAIYSRVAPCGLRR
jgi:hypothetical protein